MVMISSLHMQGYATGFQPLILFIHAQLQSSSSKKTCAYQKLTDWEDHFPPYPTHPPPRLLAEAAPSGRNVVEDNRPLKMFPGKQPAGFLNAGPRTFLTT